MMKANVVEMPTIEAPPRNAKPTTKTKKQARPAALPSAKMQLRTKLQRSAGVLLAGVATTMTTVSLAHIAGGTEYLTHGAVPTWQAWGIAIGLDVNYVGMEIAGVVAAAQHVRDRLHKLTRFGIPAVMGFSMSMNAVEFSRGATNDYELAAGVAMGIILPGLVWLAYKVAAVLADI